MTKKKLAIIISAVAAAIIACTAGIFAFASSVAKKNSIGLDKAVSIAMSDAGALEENTTVKKAKLDLEKGIFVYDIEFVVNAADEYDYVIKASDGTILEKDHDADYDKSAAENDKSSASEQTTSKTSSSDSSGNISLEKAKTIAFEHAGVSSNNVQLISARKETDDGTTYYDIEFKTSSYKYEYEIGLNGTILSYDKDALKKSTTASQATTAAQTSKYIGVDKAKNIALKKVGLSSDSVVFKKAKLERDDGIYMYEIEFVTSSKEYEFEINAVSGAIVSYSSEPIELFDD